MVFTVSLNISLAIFVVGVLYKVSTWFRHQFETKQENVAAQNRIFAAVKGVLSTAFSPKFLTLLKVIVQYRILRENRLRWLMHMFINAGFIMLLLMHALDQMITEPLFPEYYSTLNPFFFLRNLFGAMVFVGLGIAVYRRVILKVPRLKTDAVDIYAIVILAVVMLSGFLLEAAKIISYSAYQDMAVEYAGTDDEAELEALESLWVQKFAVVSPNVKGPFDDAVIEQGLEIHQESCIDCHSVPQWAFGSFLTAKILSPVATTLDNANIPDFLWYLHFLACFAGLAYLPFSKLFHLFTTPLSLLSNAVMDRTTSDPANTATRQILELDACTRCGTCGLNCSVAIVCEEMDNANILPSVKIRTLRALAKTDQLSREEAMHLQEGLFLCTGCYRCTTVCPAGINLQDLWFNTKEVLLQRGYPELLALSALSHHRGLNRDRIEDASYHQVISNARDAVVEERKIVAVDDIISDASMDEKFKKRLVASLPGDTPNYCFACSTCTATCPVVRNYDHPMEDLGLLPHQMIRAANLGLGNTIFNSNMLWRCLGCYACQENCPQGVRIADVFYELKNLATENGRERIP